MTKIRSSRPGRYRHQLLSTELVQKGSPALLNLFAQLRSQSMQLAEAEIAAVALLALFSLKGPKAFEKKPSPNQKNPSILADTILKIFDQHQLPTQRLRAMTQPHSSLYELISSLRFRGVPDSARQSLLCWLDGKYPLHLYFHVPSVSEVFSFQKKGHRIVSLLCKEPELSEGYKGRDVLSFLIHDLIHAHEFYCQPQQTLQQIGFYQWISQIHNLEIVQAQLQRSEIFLNSWNYLLSDMNSYCGHMLKTTHAILSQQWPANDFPEIWTQLLQRTSLPEAYLEIFKKVNTTEWTEKHFSETENLFAKMGSTAKEVEFPPY